MLPTGATRQNQHNGRVNSVNAIVIDKVDGLLLDALRDSGVRLRMAVGIERAQLLEQIAEHQVLLGRTRMPIDAQMIQAGRKLKIIGRAAVGTENIDKEAAERHGIQVINVPGAATDSVAELTLGLTINALRKVGEGAFMLRHGDFKKTVGSELGGKTVGIIGFGRIGQRFAEMLKPFNNTILVNDVYDVKERAAAVGATVVGMDELLARSDIISLHVNMETNSGPIIGKAEFEKMENVLAFVNTVRAAAVDISALYESLKNGRVGAYASDVLLNEPPKEPIELDLLKLSNVIITPHVGSSTNEAQGRVAEHMIPRLVGAISQLQRT